MREVEEKRNTLHKEDLMTLNKDQEKMTALVVEPQKEPYVKEINPGIHSLRSEVSGTIEAVYPFADPVALICNDEGKNIGMNLNRGLFDENGRLYDIIAGTFLVVGLGEDDFTSLSPDMVQKYMEHFKQPQQFIRLNGEIIALPMEMEKEKMGKDIIQEKSVKIEQQDLHNMALEKVENFRMKCLKENHPKPIDWSIRVCEAHFAACYGYKSRKDWIEKLETHKDLPEIKTLSKLEKFRQVNQHTPPKEFDNVVRQCQNIIAKAAGYQSREQWYEKMFTQVGSEQSVQSQPAQDATVQYPGIKMGM